MTTLLPIFVLALISAKAAAQCGGHDHAACPRFMSNGFCTNTTRSLEFRQRICGRGCGLCLADCHDTSKLCLAYARTGFCENPRFAIETKRSMCMKTCFCNKRTTTTLPPAPEIDEPMLKINTLIGTGPEPVPVVGPVPVPIVTPDGSTGPMPVAVITNAVDNSGPQPVPVIKGPNGPVPVPDLTGTDPNSTPVPVSVVGPVVRPKTRVLGGGSTDSPDGDMMQPEGGGNTAQSSRPFTTCGLLKDDANNEVFVVHEGVSLDLARHPFNDRATSILLLSDCEMDLWEHEGQAGSMLRFHSSSEHTFKLDGPYRRAISSLTCRCN